MVLFAVWSLASIKNLACLNANIVAGGPGSLMITLFSRQSSPEKERKGVDLYIITEEYRGIVLAADSHALPRWCFADLTARFVQESLIYFLGRIKASVAPVLGEILLVPFSALHLAVAWRQVPRFWLRLLSALQTLIAVSSEGPAHLAPKIFDDECTSGEEEALIDGGRETVESVVVVAGREVPSTAVLTLAAQSTSRPDTARNRRARGQQYMFDNLTNFVF